ncbi:redox protein [Planctomycetota bacterium]|jgi:putative redox protein|nr:OsmC family protein [Planctomycetota bacterium]GDY01299.1 redox protein [Planctomycetota bacterium]
MTTITAHYDGDLSTTATHGPSGATIHTDAPKDNEGQGRFFSPTDLVASALGSCMLTIMGIVARRHGLDLRGATAKVTKEMNQNPRRIGKLPVLITLPGTFTAEQKQLLETAAHGCPVHKSLHPDIASPIRFEWLNS